MSECLKCALQDEIEDWGRIEERIEAGSREFGDFKVIDFFFDPSPDDYYGEFAQGHESKIYIVFQSGDRYFRKTGHGDSYGNHSWHGPVKEVFPKQVQRIVYEYTETKEA